MDAIPMPWAQPRLDGEKKIAVLAKTLQAMSSPEVSEGCFQVDGGEYMAGSINGGSPKWMVYKYL